MTWHLINTACTADRRARRAVTGTYYLLQVLITHYLQKNLLLGLKRVLVLVGCSGSDTSTYIILVPLLERPCAQIDDLNFRILP